MTSNSPQMSLGAALTLTTGNAQSVFAGPEAVVAIVDDTTMASEVNCVSVGGGGSGAVRVGEVVTTVLDRVATEELWNDESLPSMLDKFEAFPVALVLVAAFVLLVALLVDFLEEDVVVLWLVGKVVFLVPDVVTL